MNESASPKRNGQKTGPAQPPHPQPQLFHPAPQKRPPQWFQLAWLPKALRLKPV